jgi:phosphoglycerate dehydrogenase-like enzyme
VLGLRRYPDTNKPDFVERLFGSDELDSALEQADHVAICLPLTDATRGLFNATRFARMRPGSYIYNIGRGAIIDSAALQESLASGHLAGAGLDVTDPEPLPPTSSLWDDPRVIITNHTSGGSSKNPDRTLEIYRDNISRAISGKPLRNVIDKLEGY